MKGSSVGTQRESAGFTLVEVLVAVTILAVALLAIISAFPLAYEDIAYGGKASQAVSLAQQKLEQLKAGPYPPSAGTETQTPYTLTWTVTGVGYDTTLSPANSDLQQVTVTVVWPQRVRDGSYELVGLISKPN